MTLSNIRQAVEEIDRSDGNLPFETFRLIAILELICEEHSDEFDTEMANALLHDLQEQQAALEGIPHAHIEIPDEAPVNVDGMKRLTADARNWILEEHPHTGDKGGQ